jgi:hypothetical protein
VSFHVQITLPVFPVVGSILAHVTHLGSSASAVDLCTKCNPGQLKFQDSSDCKTRFVFTPNTRVDTGRMVFR